jgi:hypothetical protein
MMLEVMLGNLGDVPAVDAVAVAVAASVASDVPPAVVVQIAFVAAILVSLGTADLFLGPLQVFESRA